MRSRPHLLLGVSEHGGEHAYVGLAGLGGTEAVSVPWMFDAPDQGSVQPDKPDADGASAVCPCPTRYPADFVDTSCARQNAVVRCRQFVSRSAIDANDLIPSLPIQVRAHVSALLGVEGAGESAARMSAVALQMIAITRDPMTAASEAPVMLRTMAMTSHSAKSQL